MLFALLSWKAAFDAATVPTASALRGHTASEAAAFDRLMARVAPVRTTRDA